MSKGSAQSFDRDISSVHSGSQRQQELPSQEGTLQYQQQHAAAKRGTFTVLNYLLSTTPTPISLPEHNHFALEVVGAARIQYNSSVVAPSTAFVDWIDAGATLVSDDHQQTSFSLRVAAGTCAIIITVW